MNRYPLTMKHPNEKRSQAQAERGVDQGSGRGYVDYRGTPDMFPPVVVNNEKQEAEYRAKGYVAHDEPFPEHGEYVEFPKWLRHKEHEPVMVSTAEQQQEAEEKGYFEPGRPDPEAVEAAHAAPYVPGRIKSEWPKMIDGHLVAGPDEPDTGPVQYPKALTPPGGGEQVFVNDAREERETFKKWGVDTVSAPAKQAASPEASNARSEKMKAIWAAKKAAKAALAAQE